jgi:hypothetical protein
MQNLFLQLHLLKGGQQKATANTQTMLKALHFPCGASGACRQQAQQARYQCWHAARHTGSLRLFLNLPGSSASQGRGKIKQY